METNAKINVLIHTRFYWNLNRNLFILDSLGRPLVSEEIIGWEFSSLETVLAPVLINPRPLRHQNNPSVISKGHFHYFISASDFFF